MGERRKARQSELSLPVQVCLPRQRPVEFYTGQLRDVSRSGIFFHSHIPLDHGAALELTFSLPAERDRGTSVPVRRRCACRSCLAMACRCMELRRPSTGSILCGRLFQAQHNYRAFHSTEIDSWKKKARFFGAAPFVLSALASGKLRSRKCPSDSAVRLQ